MATSAVAALIDRYNGIPAGAFGGTRPPIFLGEAPTTKTDGTQQRVPYVVLKDQGFRPEFNSSTGGIENGQVVVEVYATLLGSVDAIVLAIKYGGGDPEDKLGLDWGALAITGFVYGISLKRTREVREYAGFNIDGARVHRCVLTYDLVTGIAPTAPP